MKKDFNFNLSNVFDEETEMFPLMSNEDEEQINNEETPTVLPILPLRNTVLFPGVIIPITIGETIANNPGSIFSFIAACVDIATHFSCSAQSNPFS